MKIVHVETGMNFYGGAQQVAYLLEGLSRRGIGTVLACPPKSEIAHHFEGSPVRVAPLPCRGDTDVFFLFRLWWLLRRERPDVVHLHSRRGADFFGAIAAWLAGVPCVLSRRVDNHESPLWVSIKYRLHDRVIAISQMIADVLAAEGLPPEKLRVVRSSVDPQPWQKPELRSTFALEFGVPEEALWIGVVAQLIERKGHRVLFDALRALPDRERLRLICFGQGPLLESLQKTASNLGILALIRFPGFRKDLPRWLGALDLVVHPVRTEGLGVSLLQASAAGVPIVASRAGGVPEAVVDDLNGILVPPGDATMLTAALRRLMEDPVLRREMGAKGRERIERDFSVDVMVEGNLAVYRELARG